MRESRNEILLHNRRKEIQRLNPMGEFTTQDSLSLGITNRAQAQFLRSTLGAMDKGLRTFKRRSFNE